MQVDVVTRIKIDRPRSEVSAYAADPDNAPAWYKNIESITWKTAKPLTTGSRIEFVARFLGRMLVYTYEIINLAPGESLVMSTSEGPFPMETSYTWEDDGDGTKMTLRNRGAPSGFGKIAAPLLSTAMRRANENDLKRLRSILEAPPLT